MLEGMHILSFVHGLYGGSASQTLADLGADVVRIEQKLEDRSRKGTMLDQQGENLFWQLTGRNQKSAAIRLDSPEGLEAIRRLMKKYDIVIENGPVGYLKGLGLDYEILRKEMPGLIWCSCTPYGNGGPRCKEKDDELLLQAVSGLASLNGPSSSPPVPAGAALIEQHAAALIALGVIAAARDRAKTGKGHLVETNLLSSSLDLQIETVGYYSNGGRFIPRVDTGLSTKIHQSPYGIYRTADGYITVSITHYDVLKQLFTPGALDDFTAEDSMDKREEFDRVVCREMKKKTTEQWIGLFDGIKDMWYAPVNEYDQVMKDEQVIYNEPFIPIQGKDGREYSALGHVNRYDGKKVMISSSPPAFGQDTETVLMAAGYQKQELEELKQKRVIPVKNDSRKNEKERRSHYGIQK